MNLKRARLVILFNIIIGGYLLAQEAPRNVVKLQLNAGEGSLDSTIRVTSFDTVELYAPPSWSGSIQWLKDGSVLPGKTQNPLTIESIENKNAGSYSLLGAANQAVPVRNIVLDVQGPSTFVNLSSRAVLTQTEPVLIAGFVISGTSKKAVLIRGAGPSLAQFGVANPAPKPRIRVFNSAGSELLLNPFPAVQPKEFWDAIFLQAGAFPLSGGERPHIAYEVGKLSPGLYSVHLSDDDGEGGEVLLEIYQLALPPGIEAP